MNSTSNTTRLRLPSVQSVFGPIEQYQTERDKQGPFFSKSAVALEPLDVFVAHLLVNVHPGDPAILDLAAESTGGASTLLGLLHPRQPLVRALGGPLPGDRLAYRHLVEGFLQQHGTPPSLLQWLSEAERMADLHHGPDSIILIAANQPSVGVEVERWLDRLPSAIVLVFGFGPVGDCGALDALLQRFPTGSPRRLRLLRESSEALSTSRLGMVAECDNAAAEAALRRLRQSFTSNYSFLGLLRSATESAIRASDSDTTVRESDGSFLEWNDEINQLKKAAQRAQENAAAAQELHILKSRLSYRLSERFCRAAQVARHEGFFGLYRRIVRRTFWRSTETKG